MSWKKMIFGEKMPDINDPDRKERREREMNAGRKFARVLRIDKAVAAIQKFGDKYPKVFLGIVIGVAIFIAAVNVFRGVNLFINPPTAESAVKQQHAYMESKRQKRVATKCSTNQVAPSNTIDTCKNAADTKIKQTF